ncbi:MAG: hypothetical protein NZ874_07295 [Fimbriimonadales bacterium]|nr:hypothetical protein [Fimbriimonadales bacterium]
MKLNLVPAYVRQRKVNKQIIALLVLLFFVVNAGMAFWMVSVQGKLRELQTRKSDLEMQAQQVDSLYNQANMLIDSAAIALGKTEWVKRVEQHNLKYPELFSEVSRYTSPRVRYAQMRVEQGNQLQIAAFTKGIRELGLYLQTMYNCPLFTAVSLTEAALPGYPPNVDMSNLGSGFGLGAPLPAPGGGALAIPPAFGGGFAAGGEQMGGSPANLMPFRVVAYLKEPIALPTPPASVPGITLSGDMGGGFALGGVGGAPPAGFGGRGI